MSEVVVAEDMAMLEFQRFVDAWDIDVDERAMDEDTLGDFQKLRRSILRVIQSGHFTVDEKGDPRYKLRRPTLQTLETLEFSIPGGRAVLALDQYKDQQKSHKLQTYMAEMAGQPEAVFGTMDGIDLKIARAVATLFLTTA